MNKTLTPDGIKAVKDYLLALPVGCPRPKPGKLKKVPGVKGLVDVGYWLNAFTTK
jgi:hypothetical protein